MARNRAADGRGFHISKVMFIPNIPATNGDIYHLRVAAEGESLSAPRITH